MPQETDDSYPCCLQAATKYDLSSDSELWRKSTLGTPCNRESGDSWTGKTESSFAVTATRSSYLLPESRASLANAGSWTRSDALTVDPSVGASVPVMAVGQWVLAVVEADLGRCSMLFAISAASLLRYRLSHARDAPSTAGTAFRLSAQPTSTDLVSVDGRLGQLCLPLSRLPARATRRACPERSRMGRRLPAANVDATRSRGQPVPG